MLQKVKRGLSGGLNTDDSAEAIAQNEYINASGLRFGAKKYGDSRRMEMIESTRLITEGSLPAGTNLPVGRCVDTARDRVFLFRWNSNGNHGIYVIQKDETVLKVLGNSDTAEGLKFDKDMPIHSIRVYGDMLYWVNDNSEPFRINAEAAIKANNPGYTTTVTPYTFPIDYTVYTIIRKPVNYILELEKVTDGTVLVNQIESTAFKFCTQLEYRDGEVSTLSEQSLLASANFPADTYNAIDVKLPFAEKISQDVASINFFVIYADENKFFNIRRWDKTSVADLAEINAHNAGTTKLTYRFTNSTIGDAVDNVTKVKPFDSVPISARAMEIAKNRLHLGNTVLGYNTPIRSSLAFAVQNINLSNISATWEYWELVYYSAHYSGGDNFSDVEMFPYVIYIPTGSGSILAGFYYNSIQPTPPTPPLVTAINTLDFTTSFMYMGATRPAAAAWLGAYMLYSSWTSIHILDYDRDDVLIGASGTTILSNALKSGGGYRGGIVFYDRFMRQCGVFDGGAFRTAERNYTDLSSFNYGVGWSLSNTNALLEIPLESWYYSIVMTKCQTTDFFLSSRAGDINYSVFDTATNTYSITSNKTYSLTTQSAIAIKANLLYAYGLGYSYNAGDICKVHLSTVLGTVYYLPIKSVQGDWIIVDLADVGSLTSAICLFEIFSPLQADNSNRTYYEVGNINPVVGAGTALRTYSTLSGILPGDVYIKTRTDGGSSYFTENMNPNDKVWKKWDTNHGRPQYIDKIGQVAKKTADSWSNIAIPGSKVNGLSSFDALNEKVLTSDMVALRKLIITSKIQEEGSIMLAIGEDETMSLYLGENEINDVSGSVFVAQSVSVIGSDNPLRGSYGTRHPESVSAFETMVFWIDTTKGKVIQYSNAGLLAVSDYKNKKFWHSWCSAYKKVASNFWTTSGQRAQIIGNVDEFTGEYQLALPALLVTPTALPFDIFDKTKKTMVFNFMENKWVGSFPYFQESAWCINDTFYGVIGSSIYAHDVNSGYCTIAGVTSMVKLSVQESAGNFDATKVWQTVTVISKAAPDNVTFETYLPYTQQSTLVNSEFDNIEGKFYAGILKNTINDILPPNIALNEGEDIRSQTLYAYFEFSGVGGTVTRQNRFFINSIDFGINFSYGQI